MEYDVIVIGGGASGMLAAGVAAERGKRVLLLERKSQLGRKLRITGNGRCNLTNSDSLDRFVATFGRNGKFLYRALSEFSSGDLAALLARLGVPTIVEGDGRFYPADGKAASVVAAFERFMREGGVTVMREARARGIVVDSGSGAVAGVAIEGPAEPIAARSVILAMGGMSYPATGSTGDGYDIAAALGHTIVAPRPALVPLETVETFPRRLRGVSVAGVKIAVLSGGRRFASETGDLLFTHYGISGPAILALSGAVVERLAAREEVALAIDFRPEIDLPALDRELASAASASGRKAVLTLTSAFLPRSLAESVLERCGISGAGLCARFGAADRKLLAKTIKDFRLGVRAARPIAEAIVTRGGVDVREVDPRTMQSRKVKGLYFCGEVLDIDGPSGGYNLQAAFSTAHLAASNA